ncbi:MULTISPECIES: sensor histidine kinase [unclassified Thioalkalivibrio]|uniref:sensor histidine kinase n=1 Tax=unclassified Thioalkalivibrio TaxID=2621013 RepID=UPI000369F4CF|nr:MULTISPECIES: histidine kinase [unclassified Thioalkalivibrio]
MAQGDSARQTNGELSPLPDFCSAETLLRVLMVAVLLALAIALLRGGGQDWLSALALHALFIFWVALTSLLILCALKRPLHRLPLIAQIVLPPLVPIANTAIVYRLAEELVLADPALRWPVIGVATILSLVAMHYLYLQAAWQRETRAVAAAREQAMRARLRPHFLYNSMNTIAGLCRSDPERAEQITLDLADLFRATFATGDRHSLREELELVRAFLGIEQTRFGERLELDWDCPDHAGLDVPVPTLFLQPLAENAIQHGIAPARGAGRIWVRCRMDSGRVTLILGNSVDAQARGEGTGTGTEAVRLRLQHAFGERVHFETDGGDGAFEVRIRLPLATREGTP